MENKGQTAIEWLLKELKINNGTNKMEIWYRTNLGIDVKSIIEKAKEIEKEELIFFYSVGWHDGQDVIIEQIQELNPLDKGGDELGEKMYKDVYKTK